MVPILKPSTRTYARKHNPQVLRFWVNLVSNGWLEFFRRRTSALGGAGMAEEMVN